MKSKNKIFSYFVASLAIAETLLIIFRELSSGMNRLDVILQIIALYGVFYLSSVLAARNFKALYFIMSPIMMFYSVMAFVIAYNRFFENDDSFFSFAY